MAISRWNNFINRYISLPWKCPLWYCSRFFLHGSGICRVNQEGTREIQERTDDFFCSCSSRTALKEPCQVSLLLYIYIYYRNIRMCQESTSSIKYLFICMYWYIHIHIHIHIYTFTYTYTYYIHIYTYIYIYISHKTTSFLPASPSPCPDGPPCRRGPPGSPSPTCPSRPAATGRRWRPGGRPGGSRWRRARSSWTRWGFDQWSPIKNGDFMVV